MGLFSKHEEPVQPQPAPSRHSNVSSDASSPRRGLFGSKHSRDSASSPDNVHRSPTTSTHNSTGSRTNNHNFLHRLGHDKEDPSISNARQRVLSAEQAEREADRALVEARTAVRQAREHVKALELEAAEQARLATIKQHQAADISKRAAPLGREYSSGPSRHFASC